LRLHSCCQIRFLVCTKYFTSRVSAPADKQKRQSIYLDALDTLTGLHIYLGKYQTEERNCRQCGFKYAHQNEKKTDVNIATEMMTDAFQDNCDTQILVSADSDLTGPIEAIRNLFPKKSVLVAFPPRRVSADLQNVASACLYLSASGRFSANQLPEKVTTRLGFAVERPDKWR
jgi:uncharacterized LabA/DUF88 family protein